MGNLIFKDSVESSCVCVCVYLKDIVSTLLGVLFIMSSATLEINLYIMNTSFSFL